MTETAVFAPLLGSYVTPRQVGSTVAPSFLYEVYLSFFCTITWRHGAKEAGAFERTGPPERPLGAGSGPYLHLIYAPNAVTGDGLSLSCRCKILPFCRLNWDDR